MVLVVGRVVSLFRGTVLSNDVSINDQDEQATINATLALTKKQNVIVEDRLRVAMQVSELC